jgi:hypothetical protein
MAVGTVSGVNLDEAWQLIATNSPSSASSSTFSSLSGYKRFWLVYKNLTPSGATEFAIRFNGDSTTGNYGSTTLWYASNIEAENTQIKLTAINTANGSTGSAVIENSLKDVHKVTVEPSLYAVIGGGIWVPSSPTDITSIEVRPMSGTFTGTIYLYGIAA